MSMIRLSLLFFIVNSINLASSSSFENDDKAKIEVDTRIIGGRPTTIKAYPYMVNIQRRHMASPHCGATYIKPKWVLTAAHCIVRGESRFWHVENPWNFVVVAGSTTISFSSTWQIQNVHRLLPHPRYSTKSMTHDIGLVELVMPFRITRYVQYAPLPLEIDHHLFDSPKICKVIGWGRSNAHDSQSWSNQLLEVSLPLISNKRCNEYRSLPVIPADQICAGVDEGGMDSCQGDSGGPLICQGKQIGIVSWGYGCAARYSPGVYTRVDLFLNWINRTMLRSHSLPRAAPNFILIVSFLICSLIK